MNETDLAIIGWERARLAALNDETVIDPGQSDLTETALME
jgi:hypothetical protein